jgi:hypothetical protein
VGEAGAARALPCACARERPAHARTRLPHSSARRPPAVPAHPAGPTYIRNWVTYNEPGLAAKFLRHAERVARETGVAADVAAFDAAAAAFPKPPKLVAAT